MVTKLGEGNFYTTPLILGSGPTGREIIWDSLRIVSHTIDV